MRRGRRKKREINRRRRRRKKEKEETRKVYKMRWRGEAVDRQCGERESRPERRRERQKEIEREKREREREVFRVFNIGPEATAKDGDLTKRRTWRAEEGEKCRRRKMP